MPPIKKIKKVKGFPDLKILYKQKIPNDHFGLCDGPRDEITLSLKQNNTQKLLESTLFHELIHLALYDSGLSEILETAGVSEEALVLMIEKRFRSLIKFDYE